MTTTGKKNNKTIINSFIVSMRKDVKHARLWLIRDLKKKSSRLLEKKGTEQQIAKNSRKAQRCLDEANTLKQINPDQVAKYALCGEYAKTNDEEVNKCLKKLVDSKLVQKHIVEFEKTNHIPLDKRIIIMRALGAKYNKLKLKKKALEGVKPAKKEAEKDSSETEKPKNSEPKAQKKKADDESKATPVKSFEKVTAKKAVSKPKSVAASGETSNTKPKKATNEKQGSPWKVTKNIPKEMEIKQINLQSLKSEDIIPTSSEAVEPAENPEPSAQTEKPSLNVSGNSNESDDECDPFFLKDGQPPAKINNDIGSRLLNLSRTKEREFSKPPPAKKPNPPAKFNNPPNQKVQPREKRSEIKKVAPPAPTIDEKDLHPSWQAKRKEKINLAEIGTCKRNHIKFDD